MKSCKLILVIFFCLGFFSFGRSEPVTNKEALRDLSKEFTERLQKRRTSLYYELLQSQSPAQKILNADPNIRLMYIGDQGRPVYYVNNNLNAARTVSTDDVWSSSGGIFSLDGAGTTLGKLAVWEGTGVRTTHVEFGGRVTQMDLPAATDNHATHVAGTLIAAGVNPDAKGMSPAAYLAAYDWENSDSEMADAAADGMNVSSHSYSFIAGWDYSWPYWYWFGATAISTTEDYEFGFYSEESRAWDLIAYNAPYSTIVKSAGNDRDDGPAPGTGHYVWDNNALEWIWSTDVRDDDGGSDGYDCLPSRGAAKNVIAVGAVHDIPAGYSNPDDVVMSSFSSWGPTDDGRIKPDIVANGINLTSSVNNSDEAYDTYSGTSMSCPSAAGSINLLVRYFEESHGAVTPLASTVKALIIQTADECGPNPGPDYSYGWGLLNTYKAAQMIQADSIEGGHILEDALARGEIDRRVLSLSQPGTVRLTLAWTDRPAEVLPVSLNPPDLMLVHDLDLRVVHRATGTNYFPYIMDPANPGAAATTGDNFRDNIEQIQTLTLDAGIYDVYVSHKNSLVTEQAYSLVSSVVTMALDGFLCGDTNGDLSVNIADQVYLNNLIFHNGPAPDPLVVGDVNCDGNINIGDAVYLGNFVFLQNAPVPCANCLE